MLFIEENSKCRFLYHYIMVRLLAIAKGSLPGTRASSFKVNDISDTGLKDPEEEREMLNWERDDVAF
jgi:hypothetical protein